MRRIAFAVAAVGAATLVTAGASAVASPASVTPGRAVAGTALSATRPASAANPAPRRHHHLRALLRHAEHAQVTTSGRRGTVVHDAIRGVVTAVTRRSVTVRAADSYAQTYALSPSGTHVRVRPARPGSKPRSGRGSLADIHRGGSVFVLGRAADRAGAVPTARLVVVGVKR
jgi:2-C-methyl-D-erythritol 4-phosphate cytidylyltransferase